MSKTKLPLLGRLLNRSSYTGKDLFDKAIVHLDSAGGTVSLDDSVIDKPYSNLESNDLVGRFWSGKHQHVVTCSERR